MSPLGPTAVLALFLCFAIMQILSDSSSELIGGGRYAAFGSMTIAVSPVVSPVVSVNTAVQQNFATGVIAFAGVGSSFKATQAFDQANAIVQLRASRA